MPAPTKTAAEQDFDQLVERAFNTALPADQIGAEMIEDGVMHHSVQLPGLSLYLLAFRVTRHGDGEGGGTQEAWTPSGDRREQFEELSEAYCQDGPWSTVRLGTELWTVFACPSG